MCYLIVASSMRLRLGCSSLQDSAMLPILNGQSLFHVPFDTMVHSPGLTETFFDKNVIKSAEMLLT